MRTYMPRLRALLSGDIAALGAAPMDALHWALRIACALCFIGHGVQGVLTQLDWLAFYAAVGIPEWIAWPLMPIVGTLDITLGLTVLFHPCRAVLVWMAAWAGFTALMCPLAGMGWWQIVVRTGEYGPPLALLFLAWPQRLAWFDRVETRPVTPVVLLRLRWLLQGVLALFLIGHGALAAFNGDAVLMQHWSALGFSADAAFIRWVGSVEILLGLTTLFVVSRPFLVALSYWKLATALLYPLAGSYVDFWEVVQRGGDYVTPLSLLCVVYLLARPQSMSAGSATDTTPRQGLGHALRVGFAALVFTASLSTAYAWMRVDIRAREQYFEDYAALTTQGEPHSGWLPSDLPSSARFIHEVHELTSKLALASFHVSDPAQFLGYTAHLHETAGDSTCEPPAALVRPTPHWSSEILALRERLEIVPGSDHRTYAYEADTGQVFTWTCTPPRPRK